MGPHSFKCGKKVEASANKQKPLSASMGPHSFKCGKPPEGLLTPPDPQGFNGAALFQVRKENLFRTRMMKLRRLQWGRTLSSAESFDTRRFFIRYFSASMGPHSFKCGKFSIVSINPTRSFQLQWGRTLSSAESARAASIARRAAIASMGPHSFKCGKKLTCFYWYRHLLSFNGAALFQVRKVDGDEFVNGGCCSGFNGAALFQVRKGSQWSKETGGVKRFNGAALFQVRKVAGAMKMFFWHLLLQWGRTLSSAESCSKHQILHCPQQASMGPHSFKCGKE